MCCAQTFRRSIKHDVEPDHCVLVLGALGAGSGRWVGSRLWALDSRRWVLESKLWVAGCRPQWRQGVGSKSMCRAQQFWAGASNCCGASLCCGSGRSGRWVWALGLVSVSDQSAFVRVSWVGGSSVPNATAQKSSGRQALPHRSSQTYHIFSLSLSLSLSRSLSPCVSLSLHTAPLLSLSLRLFCIHLSSLSPPSLSHV